MNNCIEKKSVCSYCGTGCGVVVETKNNKIVSLKGDVDHPSNFGMLCSKGKNLHLTVDSPYRLADPMIRKTIDEEFKKSSFNDALSVGAKKFADIIKKHGPESVAFYVSGQLLTEDYYIFNKLMKGFIGSNNIDTNSRLCMSSAVAGYKRAFGVDGPPTCYEDIDYADNIFIAGANPAYAHPIVFRRMENAKEKNPNLKVVLIDPRKTESASIADLHLQILPGTDVALFQAMLNVLIWENMIDEDFINNHTNNFEEIEKNAEKMTPKRAGKICGVKASHIARAAYWFGKGKTLSFWTMGLNQSVHGTDKNNALINLHLACASIGKKGEGPFSLTGQPNAMGGREVGGLSNVLPGHRSLENKDDRLEVQNFWKSKEIKEKPGLTATEIIDELHSGKLKALWVVCTNPVVSLPNSFKAEDAFKKAELIMVSDAYSNSDTLDFAHIVLPAAGWGEKEGTMTNAERRVSLLSAPLKPYGSSMPDWKIAKDFANKLEEELNEDWKEAFDYKCSEDIFNEYKELTKGRDLDISELSYDILKTQGPQQWPYRESEGESKRLYKDFKFETKDKKANFIDIEYLPLFEEVDDEYNFSLTTGRLRDQWHTMTKTGLVPILNQHRPHQALYMCSQDAEKNNFKKGDLVKVVSKRGKVVVSIEISKNLRDGLLFMPMHFGEGTSKGGRVNNLISDEVDKISKEPEFKHVAVKIIPYEDKSRVTLLLKGDFSFAGKELIKKYEHGFVTVVGSGEKEKPVTWIEVALKEEMTEENISLYDQFIEELLNENENELYEKASYNDKRKNIYKKAWISDNSLKAIRFISKDREEIGWLKGLVDSEDDISKIRPFLLAPGGDLAKVDKKGRIVCSCDNVGEKEITNAVQEGINTIEGIKAKLNACTGCGSCVPEVKEMLKG